MTRVAIYYPVLGFVFSRMTASMKKSLPEDIEIVSVLTRETIVPERREDIVIGHVGTGMTCPYWAYISPKAVISEMADDVMLSYFTDKDIIFLYQPSQVEYALSKGVNAVLWPRPVDPEIFYRVDIPKKYKILSVGAYHGDSFLKLSQKVLERVGGKHVVLSPSQVEYDGIERDVCWPGRHDDKMREYYCSSEYAVTIVPRMEYYPKCFGCGYENGAVEAAFCGCPPIVVDEIECEYLKYWWGDFAEFVNLSNFEHDLCQILSRPYQNLSDEIVKSTVARFSAPVLWKQFWGEIMAVLR